MIRNRADNSGYVFEDRGFESHIAPQSKNPRIYGIWYDFKFWTCLPVYNVYRRLFRVLNHCLCSVSLPV